MWLEGLRVRQFEKGMYGQADSTDIPDDAAAIVMSEPEAPYGTIRGIAQDSLVFNTASAGTSLSI